MNHNIKNALFFLLLILSYGFFSYYFFGKWWHSSVGTFLILIFSFLIWGKDFIKRTGLQLNLKTIAKSIILAGIVVTGSLLMMKYIAGINNVQIVFTNWRDYYHDIFYILNEEIVIGAILLYALIEKSKILPVVASVGLAVFFASVHFIFYRWIFLDSGVIGFSTLTTLFLVGFVRNNLIIQAGHIGYSWALHFGWMAVMFGCMHVERGSNLGVSEPGRFNLYLGSVEMLIITLIMAGFSLVFLMKKNRTH